MKVPEGQKVMIGSKIYTPDGPDLPSWYKLPEKKKATQPSKNEVEKK